MLVVLALAGVALRLWIVSSPLGLIDGDEAVVGLMARDLLRGHAEAFFWGQEYGGSHESVLVAGLLAVGLRQRWAMEVVPVGLHLAAAALVWRIGLRTVGARAAGLAAGVYWAASPALIWWSTKERGFYGATLVAGLLAVLAVVRLDRSPGAVGDGGVPGPPDGGRTGHQAIGKGPVFDSVVLGLALGTGWHASPQILHFALPAGLWLVWAHRRDVRRLGGIAVVAGGGAVIGALPWLWANSSNSWSSLGAAGGARFTFGDPWSVFFAYGVPMVLGLRRPITLGWEFPGARFVYLAVMAAVAALLLVRPKPLRLVVLTLALYRVIFAALPTTYYYGEPRYLDFLWPFLALPAGWALAAAKSTVLQALAIALLLAVTVNGVLHMTRLAGPPGMAFEDISPQPLAPVVAVLRANGVDRVFADYWAAYRLSWESGGDVVGAPLSPVRSASAEATVRRDERPAYLVVAGACPDIELRRALSDAGVAFEALRAGYWNLVWPGGRVLPEEVLPEWAAARGGPPGNRC